jgi:LPXTG-site transpeptidase (sortase) family protein
MKIARVNTFLVVIIVLVNAYIIVMPFVPTVSFWIDSHSPKKQQLQHDLSVTAAPGQSVQGEQLVVPALLLNTPINEGNSESTLQKGLWRLPFSSTPPRGGNTVIVGHRFTYTNPEGVFYNLNKLQIDDEIGVFWNSARYLYRVSNILVVPPTDTSVQASSNTPELTLYTCTPLWLPKNRLVVVAKLESET